MSAGRPSRVATPLCLLACLVLLLVAGGAGAQAALRLPPPAGGGIDSPARVPLAAYAGLRRVFRQLTDTSADQGNAPSEAAATRAAALFEFEQVLAAVFGNAFPLHLDPVSASPSAGPGLDAYRAALAGSRPLLVPGDAATRGRDEAVYQLHSLGYSGKEIADILARRITRAALDDARKMMMLGYTAAQASDFLDREYARLASARARGGRTAVGAGSAFFDALAVSAARRHGLDPALVRAVIACESGWDAGARSRVGALGLMQLMPGTARELGVNPLDPAQNVEGGARYLAALLRRFGTLEGALIAYNAGPGYAARHVQGLVALYGETRAYVRRVLSLLQAGRTD